MCQYQYHDSNWKTIIYWRASSFHTNFCTPAFWKTAATDVSMSTNFETGRALLISAKLKKKLENIRDKWNKEANKSKI